MKHDIERWFTNVNTLYQEPIMVTTVMRHSCSSTADNNRGAKETTWAEQSIIYLRKNIERTGTKCTDIHNAVKNTTARSENAWPQLIGNISTAFKAVATTDAIVLILKGRDALHTTKEGWTELAKVLPTAKVLVIISENFDRLRGEILIGWKGEIEVSRSLWAYFELKDISKAFEGEMRKICYYRLLEDWRRQHNFHWQRRYYPACRVPLPLTAPSCSLICLAGRASYI